MSKTERRYMVDFYCLTQNGIRGTTYLKDYLKSHLNGHASAVSLDPGSPEKYQIRSIEASANEKVFKAVFGRCRYGETPEQTSTDGHESDVELKPDHALVEKNHFLFFVELNLIVYQRNASAGSHSKLQKYFNSPRFLGINLEPVLTEDSYEKIMRGGPLKKIEVSIMKPNFTLDPEEQFVQEAIDMFATAGAGSMKVTLSADRGRSLTEVMRTSVTTLARFGKTRIARVHLLDDNDQTEVVDLIGDRIKQPMTIPLGLNGRPTANDVYAGLAQAKDERSEDLQAFFG